MIKKVPVKHLRPGVYIEKIGQGWLRNPFLVSSFKIKSKGQIEKFLNAGIDEVYINTDKGLDAAAPSEQTGEKLAENKDKARYISISPKKILVDSIIPFNIHLRQGEEYPLFLRKDEIFTPKLNHQIESQRIESVHVPAEEWSAIKTYEQTTRREREVSRETLAPGFESEEKVAQYNDYLNNYMPVNADIFSPGDTTPVNLYIEKDTVVSLILRKNGFVPEAPLFSEEENEQNRKNILIAIDDYAMYKNFIKEITSQKKSDKSERAVKIRVAVIKENSKIVTKDLIDDPRSGKTVHEAKGAVSEMIESILENPTSFYGLMGINSHDYYTYVHSINVCTLSIGLAIAMGLKGQELFHLALGSLMHDVGKQRVPAGLINKPGKLSDAEFILMKKHVDFGYELMKGHTDLIPEDFFPMMQHHEKLNGMGYPKGLEQEEIHTFGRIAGIVDVYDALTTERSYKKAFKPFDAASLLSKHTEEFDQNIFKEFVAMLGRQAMEK